MTDSGKARCARWYVTGDRAFIKKLLTYLFKVGQVTDLCHALGECNEEWDEYYRICKDKDYLGQANVGGAVDSDGVPLEPGNPPRFCLFTWIAVIEGVCPAVALTLRAAFSAQATSTAVERTFSQAGLSSGQLRTDLKSDTLCRHIYLRMNSGTLAISG